MESTAYRAIAIVGMGAVMPDAPSVTAFWENLKNGRYSITDVTADRWDPAFYYDADPKAPDIFQDWWLGTRICVGSSQVALAYSAARSGRHGRGAEVGHRGHARGA
jgi:hypothetical protein